MKEMKTLYPLSRCVTLRIHGNGIGFFPFSINNEWAVITM